MGLPSWRVNQAFLGGELECLHSLMAESLRRFPECVRLDYHFILHQVRALETCPLHHLPLREHCSRCAAHLAYELGASKVHGPITCPSSAAPLLPVTRGGYPTTGTITAGKFSVIARWLAIVRRRAAQPAWRNCSVVVDTRRPILSASTRESLHTVMPVAMVRRPVTRLHRRWTDDVEYRELEQRYWRDANARWHQCNERSRHWYRRLLKGAATQDTSSVHVLAFVYWRMTGQGGSNPYLLRHGHRLPLYGVAEWQAAGPAPDKDDLDPQLGAFSAALEASWNDWLDCIDLLGVSTLEHRTWRLRAGPSSYVSLPQRQRKRATGNFT